jgi:diaminopimelate dehydrogenase
MINIAIVGYGNVARGVHKALKNNPDMKLSAVFSRRPETVRKEIGSTPVIKTAKDAPKPLVPIDVAILCGGSKEDVPVQGPLFARWYNTVDSFDTHASIPDYFSRMDVVAKESGNVSIISAGWDPGIFSLERVLGDAFLPGGRGYTFWGIGVSQGHSDAARTVPGVIDARSYTHPVESAMKQVRDGETPEFTSRQKHRRVVYVVAEEGADKEKIKKAITSMPNYFSDYDTEVNFITREQMAKEHSAYPHGGFVMTSGVTDNKNKQILKYRCRLSSNPEFTGSVLVACARAAFRLKTKGHKGALTMLDIPPALYSPHPAETLRSKYT